MDLKKLKEPLLDSDIEFRIGNTSPEKRFSLLAYKTARADMARLDEVCGAENWQNRHYVDSKGNVVCSIGIYDDNKEEWIWKEDTGAESFSEKEKGSYSDSFKRAGFRWGIGIELYKYPRIWVNWSDWKEYKGKKIPTARVKDWVKSGDNILDEKGRVVYTFKTTSKPTSITPDDITKALTNADTLGRLTTQYHKYKDNPEWNHNDLLEKRATALREEKFKKNFDSYVELVATEKMTSGKLAEEKRLTKDQIEEVVAAAIDFEPKK